MARVCQYSGKKTTSGHNVSHSQRKTKRTFAVNLIRKRLQDPETGEMFVARISTKALKTLTKNPRKMLEFARMMRNKSRNRAKRLLKRGVN